MADSLSDRITSLKAQTDDDLKGRLRLGSALLRVFPAFLLFAFILSSIFSSAPEVNQNADPEQRWQAITNEDFEDRLNWLGGTALFSPGGSALYQWYAEAVVSTFHHKAEKKPQTEDLIDLGGMYASITRAFTSLWLRAGFVLIAFWPVWLVGSIAGFTTFRRSFRGKRTDDLLGICDRGQTPFYSGIYGPLRPNNSFSATDLSCPNLACPEMVPAEAAQAHRLGLILKQHGALNQTNLDLSRIILQYRDFPCFVENEQAAEEVGDHDPGEAPEKIVGVIAAFVTNVNGTIETSAVAGLEAALAAHEVLKQYVAEAQRRNLAGGQLNANFSMHCELIQPYLSSLSPLARMLVGSLTPSRAFALGRFPPQLLASAFLATEAGKCLVYKRDGTGFSRISRYPHLQARSIIQSLVSFGREYNGDTRLVIRQAIICSRRHGDFGRAFLPDRMPVESRALRDWLEILYEDPTKREMVASLVEQDAHIEEISLNWRSVYARRIRQSLEVTAQAAAKTAPFWKGLVYKSVVLVPMPELVGMALRGVDETRIRRVAELLKITRKYQTSISISARLPGFKRQAVDTVDVSESLPPNDPQRGLFDRWYIVRRMLTRYNWLSTRVGDDAVPDEGFVQGLVVSSEPEGARPELTGFDMLVPIRHRRYEEIFGKAWEGTYFIDSPHPNNIRVFVDRNDFQQAMKREQENLKKLTPISAGNKAASA